MITCLQSGKFIPEKSNIWRDCVDGHYDWVQEHILEVRASGLVLVDCNACILLACTAPSRALVQGAPLNESDHCGDPPLL